MSPLITYSIILELICFPYVWFKINKMSALNKLDPKYSIIIPTAVCLIYFGISFIRIAVFFVILAHFVVFMGLTDIIFYFINKNREKKIWIQTPISFGFTVIYLSISLFFGLKVFETNYSITTNKMNRSLRIAQITDVHLCATFGGDKFGEYMDEISGKNVDLLVLTGDFVDDETKRTDMVKACDALGRVKTTYGVYFAFGNHEAGYYEDYRDFKRSDLVDNLLRNNVIILEDEVAEFDDFYIIGRKDKSYKGRQSIDELVADLDKDKYKILLNHQPNDYDNEKGKVDLVLSGHTHGGNIIPVNFFVFFLNDQVYGMKEIDGTNFLVSSGISDWELPFNNVTIQEYVIITIN